MAASEAGDFVDPTKSAKDTIDPARILSRRLRKVMAKKELALASIGVVAAGAVSRLLSEGSLPQEITRIRKANRVVTRRTTLART